MVNCNPETVSTDYDTSDRLYFEPLTLEHVLEILRVEQENGTLHGVIVQFGGQTPLKLANALHDAGIPILGTTPDAIDLAEDRERFQSLLHRLGLNQPVNGIARSPAQAMAVAKEIGYPLVIRPSYVLGGRAMEIVRDDAQLTRYIRDAVQVSGDTPVLLDSYLSNAIEVDVDAICDGTDVHVAGVMEHIEEAGVHSGDSACSLPPWSLDEVTIAELERQTESMALALGVVGLMNVQFAIQNGDIYVLEVNPRASRTVPFVAKATDSAIAAIAARVMAGEPLSNFPLRDPYPQGAGPDDPLPYADPMTLADPRMPWFSVKEAVMPFNRFPGVDTLLGPEMRSTGEVMGWDRTFPRAFLKAQLGAGTALPTSGTLFVSVKDGDKTEVLLEATGILHALGFQPARHRRHRDLPDRPRHPDHPRQQGLRGPPAHRRHPEGRRRPDRLQHHRRRPVDRRQPRHPRADAVGADPVLHDRRRGAGGGAGDAGSAGGGFAGAVVAGIVEVVPCALRNFGRAISMALTPARCFSDLLVTITL